MAIWMRALDEQLDLIRFWQSRNGVDLGKKVLGHLSAGPFGATVGDWTPEDLAGTEAERLNRAETYFVNKDMGQLTVSSCQSNSLIPQPLKRYHLPTESGFAYFEEEVILPAKDPIPIKAVLWRPTVVTVGEWPAGERALGVALSFYASSTSSHGHAIKLVQPSPTPRLWLYETHGWPFDVSWYGDAFEGEEFEEEIDFAAELRRFMSAFWAHLQTTVYVWNEQQPTDRHTRKRAVRAGFLADPEKIRVITLRKKYHRNPDADGDGDGWAHEYSHRWIRRGHWRHQWYPKAAIHRQIWIDETVCGPEDLPLVVRDRIYHWKR
jgi:hypothetical protein